MAKNLFPVEDGQSRCPSAFMAPCACHTGYAAVFRTNPPHLPPELLKSSKLAARHFVAFPHSDANQNILDE